MTALLSSAPFWICVSIACYAFGQKVQRRTGSALFNPLLIASVLVGLLLVCTGTSYETYNQSGRLISFFLTPATVALAVPIYRKLDVLRQNLFPILAGALVGSVVSIASVILFSRLFGLSDTTMRSLIPKSVTTPIAVSLSEMLGGLAPVTTIAVVFTGIVGAMLRRCSSSASACATRCRWGFPSAPPRMPVGTSARYRAGETEGAMSGLAIGIAGLLTALIVSVGSLLLSI